MPNAARPTTRPATRPGRLAVFPVYRDNPYLNMMLLAPRASGWSVLESARLEHFERDLRVLGRGDVVHVHWTAPVVQRASAVEEARTRYDRFRRTIDEAKDRGAALLWTVHNSLPHDLRHESLEVNLNRYLAATADVVHVLNAGTDREVEPFYDLKSRTVVHIPHPSYSGVYEGSVSREQARAALGIENSEYAVLFFGQLRPYKGVDVLIDAVARLDQSLSPVLLLAGKTSDEDVAVIDALLPPGTRTVRHHKYVDDSDVQAWFEAADVAVFPYRRVLNSGSLHLAATFGVTTVLPDERHLRDEFGEEQWIRWFEPGDPQSLARVLSLPVPPRESTRDFVARLAPFSISRRYDALLADMVSEKAVPDGVREA